MKFARIYRLDPPKAMRILWDLYFYVDMFNKAIMGQKKPYSRVRALLFMEHGIALSGQTIKRWYKRIDKNKREYE